MIEYPKIKTLFARDSNHKVIVGKYSCPEFAYLQNCDWEITEKIDGTNIRVFWDHITKVVSIRGRTNNASIQAPLLTKLLKMFPESLFEKEFEDKDVLLFGEGYGEKINGGEKYLKGDVDFLLFDCRINNCWLSMPNLYDVAKKLHLKIVPVETLSDLMENLDEIVCYVKNGFTSALADCPAEGVVIRPMVDLQDTKGNRIIAKLKTRDF